MFYIGIYIIIDCIEHYLVHRNIPEEFESNDATVSILYTVAAADCFELK